MVQYRTGFGGDLTTSRMISVGIDERSLTLRSPATELAF